MATPEFILELRKHIGHSLLWLSGASAVVFRNQGSEEELLLVKRRDTGEWALPSGIVEPGENPSETVRREVLEETGVQIELERMVWLIVQDVITYDNGDECQFLDHGFLARWKSGEARVADDESTQVGWFSPAKLPEPRHPLLEAALTAALAPAGPVVLEF